VATYEEEYERLYEQYPGVQYIAVEHFNSPRGEMPRVLAMGNDRVTVAREADQIVPPTQFDDGRTVIGYNLLHFPVERSIWDAFPPRPMCLFPLEWPDLPRSKVRPGERERLLTKFQAYASFHFCREMFDAALDAEYDSYVEENLPPVGSLYLHLRYADGAERVNVVGDYLRLLDGGWGVLTIGHDSLRSAGLDAGREN